MEAGNENEGIQPPVVAKEAETKLKDMSRKAKERQQKTQGSRRAGPQKNDTNLRLLLVGGVGIGVLGILYLMLRPKEELNFVPTQGDKYSSPKPVKKRQHEAELRSEKKQEPKRATARREAMTQPEFEINSF